MKPEAIDALDQAIPGARQERPLPDAWSGEFTVVSETDQLAGEIEDGLFGDDGLGDAPEPHVGDSMELPPSLPNVEGTIGNSPLPDHEGYASLPDLADRLGEVLGSGFPGAPSGPPTTGPKSGVALRLPTDVLAFYLPWHDFPKRLWGIYLIVEGIEALGTDIYLLSRPWLSRAEANRVARMFLFHHEAYHNVAETFAARLEVSHRRPCYVGGFRHVWRHGFGRGLHEEGLADAYAFYKIKKLAFEGLMPKGPWRTFKRGVAAAALRRILDFSPPPYDSAVQIVSGAVDWNGAEHELQEANHGACVLGVPTSPPGIWLASGYAMHPSLGRNRKFSYVIDRKHPALRLAAKVPHFARREFVRRLLLAVGGSESGGGKHPKIVSSTGRSVPVPGHTEIPRGTCRKILRQLGLNISLRRFMEASDGELEAWRRAGQLSYPIGGAEI